MLLIIRTGDGEDGEDEGDGVVETFRWNVWELCRGGFHYYHFFVHPNVTKPALSK
ncbi:hypothetical protein [Coleofasciculus sp. F4-SAH-05]|jgi:hypothetical protein|uniref:hypothetical protein n=1 Tax=Coleofasciculus TaxID=669368 RepID=UPI0032F42D96